MIRGILSVIVGLLAGSAVARLLQWIGQRFYPAPAGVDLQSLEALQQYVATAPTGMLLSILAAWAGGAFAGGLVAALLSERRRGLHALAVGALQAALAIALFTMIPHPAWFMLLGVSLFLPLAGLGGLVVGREPGSG